MGELRGGEVFLGRGHLLQRPWAWAALAALGQPDQLRPPVVGRGDALGVAALHQVVDDLPHRLLGQLRPLGDVGEAQPLPLDEAEDAAVGGPDVAVFRLLQLGPDAMIRRCGVSCFC